MVVSFVIVLRFSKYPMKQ